jgi:hypothetical protein
MSPKEWRPPRTREEAHRLLSRPDRPRRVGVNFAVPNLQVSRPWRVGPATILPGGRALDRIATFVRDGQMSDFFADDLRKHVDRESSTIRVPGLLKLRQIDSPAVNAARDTARDVIAVLRLFQASRAPVADTDWQTFGLAVDTGSVLEPRWYTDRGGRPRGIGWESHGVGPPWRFQWADMVAYRADARFAFLDAALTAGDANAPDSWQARALAAIRTWNLATIMGRPATRIVLLATALEGLLGNRYVPGGRATGGHVLAKRAGYLWCGYGVRPEIAPHRAGQREACAFLTTTTDPRKDPILYHRSSRVWACTFYGDVRTLYDDRNAAVHGAESRWDAMSARRRGWYTAEIILATLGWIIETSSTSISDLDRAIASLQAA